MKGPEWKEPCFGIRSRLLLGLHYLQLLRIYLGYDCRHNGVKEGLHPR